MDRNSTPDHNGIRMLAELTAEERAVVQAIRNTAYGAVEVTLHQMRIVQIVRTEKVRLEGKSPQA